MGIATIAVGAPTLGIGAMMLAFGYLTVPADDCASSDPCNDGPALRRNGWILTGIGALLSLGGLIAAVHYDSAVRREDADNAARAHRAVVSNLVERATAAARSGDCETVREIEPQLASVDPKVHATYFANQYSPLLVCLQGGRSYAAVPTGDPLKDRKRAFALTATARSAARDGDCATALGLQANVRALDVSVHDAWFVTDEAINPCLTPSVPPAQPSP